MRTRSRSWWTACALALAGCGEDGTNGPGGTGGAIDGLDTGGTGGTEGDDEGLDDGGTGGWDLGNADDDAGPEVETCDEMAPLGFPIPTDPSCETEPQIGAFTPVVEWTKSAWTENGSSQQSVTAPIVVQLSDDDLDGDIDDDDTPDIAYVTYDSGGMLRAISGDGGVEVLSVSVPAFNRQTSIAAADVDLDGIAEIVGIDSNGRVVVFEHDGTTKWTSVALGGHVATHDNAAAISDMDGDGVPEIIAGRAILDAAGNVIAAGAHGTGSAGAAASLSFAVDLDGDGMQEVVVGNAVYRMDGSDVWFNSASDGFPAVADLDGDGTPEIVVVTSGQVRAQSSIDGTILWTAPIPGGNGGPPTIADYDGDGFAEIGVAGGSSYTVWEGDGTQRWTNVTQDLSSGITGSAVYDFEGDGVADVVYADETRLWVYAGHDGTVKLSLDEHSSGTRIEYPIVADVDGDGEVEIAYVNEQYQSNYRGLTVIGDANHSWRPGRKIWNQHAYHITNVADDGSIPAVAAQNWKTFNNFRSGDTSPPDGLKIPGVELFAPEPCAAECEADLRTLWVQIGNGGAGLLSAGVDVDVYGVAEDGTETLLETIVFADALPAGLVTDGIEIQVAPADHPNVRLVATPHEIVCNVVQAEVEVAVPACPLAPPPQG
jgi:hypothetical protein